MKRSVLLMGWIIFLALMFVAGTILSEQAFAQNIKCCIAGKYKGVHKDIASKTCPKPETADFIMEIAQDQKCGSTIKGTVTDVRDGSVNSFVGTVVPGKGECCNIQGSWKKPDEVTTFKGTLCKKDKMWSGKGTYTNKHGTTVCNGTWEMSQ